MIITKKNRHAIYECLFKEGVMVAKKDTNLAAHPDLPSVPNLQVMKAMQSLKSRDYVREQFAWRHYYWCLTNEGIDYLRSYMNLPAEIVPASLKKTSRAPDARARPSRGPEGAERAPGGDDRSRYRRGGPPGGDKKADVGAGANPEFEFRGGYGRGRGRGAPRD